MICHSVEEKDDRRSDLTVYSVSVAPNWASFGGLSNLRTLKEQEEHLVCGTRSLHKNGCVGWSEENIRDKLRT